MSAAAQVRGAVKDPGLSDLEFEALRQMIHEVTGISLADNKRTLLVARLSKRLRDLDLGSYKEYIAYVRAHGDELGQMTNAVTTNKTSFFREAHHFDLLRKRLEHARDNARGGPRRLRIWSAGCSTGEEPYSIAMVVADVLGASGDWDVKILASDIDTDVLTTASQGVYSRLSVVDVPSGLRESWLDATSTGKGGAVRVKDELKRMIGFRQINLIEHTWPIRTRFDLIFCRNVTIYFDRPTQKTLYERFARQLRPGGLFFAGHSENLMWLPELFSTVGQTVYTVKDTATAPVGASMRPGAHAAARPTPPMRDATIRSGELYASLVPSNVRTILGSCIAVCLHDPEAKAGGMNHFMLPTGDDDGVPSARYGAHALERLLHKMVSLGAKPERIQAKVFGGAHVTSGDSSVPEDNVKFARQWLAERGIPIVAEHVGGDRSLLVHYETHTGRAKVRVSDAAGQGETP